MTNFAEILVRVPFLKILEFLFSIAVCHNRSAEVFAKPLQVAQSQGQLCGLQLEIDRVPGVTLNETNVGGMGVVDGLACLLELLQAIFPG